MLVNLLVILLMMPLGKLANAKCLSDSDVIALSTYKLECDVVKKNYVDLKEQHIKAMEENNPPTRDYQGMIYSGIVGFLLGGIAVTFVR